MLLRVTLLCVVGLLAFTLIAADSTVDQKLKVDEPKSSENLTVWLVSGPDRSNGRHYLTLSEAMEQRKLIVHETGTVNQLAVENVSDEVVFIPAGSIVKGGKQDRTIGTDLICTKQDGKMPIDAFCVEAGRWEQRGGESVAAFSSNSAMVSGKAMKMAGNANTPHANQSRVWSSVASAQQQLEASRNEIHARARDMGVSVEDPSMPALALRATTSPSSYQLTVESEGLKKLTQARRDALLGAIEGKTDVVGYVYAVNNKIAGGNVYASPELFKKLWPMLLDAAIVESIAERAPTTQPTKAVETPSPEQVQAALADREKVTRTRELNQRTMVKTYDMNDTVMLDTFDGDLRVSRSLLVKPEERPENAPSGNLDRQAQILVPATQPAKTVDR